MEMISQGYPLWAVAVRYDKAAGPQSVSDVLSTGQVVGWQTDPALTEDDRKAVLVPLVLWTEGPAAQTDGSVMTGSHEWSGVSVIAFGLTREQAEHLAKNAASSAFGNWRK